MNTGKKQVIVLFVIGNGKYINGNNRPGKAGRVKSVEGSIPLLSVNWDGMLVQKGSIPTYPIWGMLLAQKGSIPTPPIKWRNKCMNLI